MHVDDLFTLMRFLHISLTFVLLLRLVIAESVLSISVLSKTTFDNNCLFLGKMYNILDYTTKN